MSSSGKRSILVLIGMAMPNSKKLSIFQRFAPLATGLVTWVAILANDNIPDYLFYGALIVVATLILTWVFSELGWIGRVIKAKLFGGKISRAQTTRLQTLLDDGDNMLSYSYTHSPFYVWHNISNDYCPQIRMDYRYLGVVSAWLFDTKAQLDDPAFSNKRLLSTLSKAVAEVNRLAERVEKDLETVFKIEDLSEQDRKRLRKEWDASCTQFNNWVNDFRSLFKELNRDHDLGCAEYFHPLAIVE